MITGQPRAHFLRKVIFRGPGYVLMAAAIYFLYGILRTSWRQAATSFQSLNVLSLLAAFLLTGLMVLLMPRGWRLALSILNYTMKSGLSAFIHFRTSIYRYLPGSFWQFTARAYWARREGVSLALYAGSSFLELFFLLACGGLFSGVGLACYYRQPWFLIVSLLCLLAGPVLLLGGSRLIPARWNPLPAINLSGKMGAVLNLAGNYLLVWVVYGAAIYILLKAFPPGYALGFGETVSLNALAWAIGFLSLSPGGLGVREMGLALLLPPEYKTAAIMTCLLQRVMEMSWEALLCLVSTIMLRNRRSADSIGKG